jgi:hypothetical protein
VKLDVVDVLREREKNTAKASGSECNACVWSLSYYIKFDDGLPGVCDAQQPWVGIGWVIWMMAKVLYVWNREKVKEKTSGKEETKKEKNGWFQFPFRHVSLSLFG